MTALSALALTAAMAGAEASPGSEAPGIHGMLVFGSDVILASHLPMFRPKHRYQAVYEVSFGPEGDAAYREEQRRAGGHGLFTLEPLETFRLPELGATRATFPGDLHAGHFEREGHRKILGAATVIVNQRVAWHPFRRAHARPRALSYLLVGPERERHLVHWISRPPDFDQVLAVSGIPALDGPCQVVVPGRSDEVPLRTGEVVAALVACDRGPERPSDVQLVRLRAGPQVYLEQSDLADDGLDAAP